MIDASATSAHAAPARRFRFVADWPAPAAEDAEAIRGFWRREHAFNDEAQMTARLPQVVMHALDGDEVAAVSTAVAVTPPIFGQPVYYYRSFVGRKWRTTILVESLLKRSQALLGAFARERDFPCIGVLLELENARFRKRMRMPVWSRTGFVYVGRSGRGLEYRVAFFGGATLKDPS